MLLARQLFHILNHKRISYRIIAKLVSTKMVIIELSVNFKNNYD